MTEIMVRYDDLRRYCEKRHCGSVPLEYIKQMPTIVAEPVNRWIPCSERLPEYDSEVLAYSLYHGAIVIIPQHFKALGVTHWMPTPEPPEREVSEDETL